MEGNGEYKTWGDATQMRYHPNNITWAYYTRGPITRKPVTPHAMWRHPVVRVGSRGPATRTCHINATKGRAWVGVALPRRLACHVTSRRAMLARGSCGDNTPFFVIFKGIKIKINSGKIQEIQKSIYLKI